jgi:hypothetical protein
MAAGARFWFAAGGALGYSAEVGDCLRLVRGLVNVSLIGGHAGLSHAVSSRTMG